MSKPDPVRLSVLAITCLLALACFGLGSARASAFAVAGDQACAVTDPVCILIVPDGSGMAFAEARTSDGAVVDATVHVQVVGVDEFGPLGPACQYPREDIWLEPEGDGPGGCEFAHVAVADAPTDQDGWTMFSMAPRAGGWSRADVTVVVGGIPATGSPYYLPSLPIYFNSPDLDGDLQVDLSDVVVFTRYLGATCP
jgi:hypothetical protein